jgi:uncharacterized protein YxeA
VKTIIITLVLLSIIIGMGIFFQNMLINESHEIITGLKKITELIQDEKWSDAKADMTKINNRWQHIRKKWHAVTDHEQIGLIDESLARLEAYISVKEKKDCLAEIAALQQNIRYIPDKEKLTLSNIF